MRESHLIILNEIHEWPSPNMERIRQLGLPQVERIYPGKKIAIEGTYGWSAPSWLSRNLGFTPGPLGLY